MDRRFEEPGRYGVDIEAWAENHRGELVVRGLVAAQPYYNADDETRQRAGQPPLVVTAQEEEARLARLTRGHLPRRPEPAQRPGAVPPRPAPAPARKAAPSKPAKARPAKARKPAKAPKPARRRKPASSRKAARRPVRAARTRPRARKPAARSRPRGAKRR